MNESEAKRDAGAELVERLLDSIDATEDQAGIKGFVPHFRAADDPLDAIKPALDTL